LHVRFRENEARRTSINDTANTSSMRFSIRCNPKVTSIGTPSCPNLEFLGEARAEVDGGERSEIGIRRNESG
jgi:hypothetical protein